VTLSIAENADDKTPRADKTPKERAKRSRSAKDIVTLRPGAVRKRKRKKILWLLCFILVIGAIGAALAAFLLYCTNYFGGGK
jgi:hypothetical protein